MFCMYVNPQIVLSLETFSTFWTLMHVLYVNLLSFESFSTTWDTFCLIIRPAMHVLYMNPQIVLSFESSWTLCLIRPAMHVLCVNLQIVHSFESFSTSMTPSSHSNNSQFQARTTGH